MLIYDIEISGSDVDAQTRCAHYHSEIDIIAIRFKCCRQWFPCFKCHAEHTNHLPEVWKVSERTAKAIFCGGCGHQQSIDEYFNCASVCPKCRSKFNPGCANHYDLYFEICNRSEPPA